MNDLLPMSHSRQNADPSVRATVGVAGSKEDFWAAAASAIQRLEKLIYVGSADHSIPESTDVLKAICQCFRDVMQCDFVAIERVCGKQTTRLAQANSESRVESEKATAVVARHPVVVGKKAGELTLLVARPVAEKTVVAEFARSVLTLAAYAVMQSELAKTPTAKQIASLHAQPTLAGAFNELCLLAADTISAERVSVVLIDAVLQNDESDRLAVDLKPSRCKLLATSVTDQPDMRSSHVESLQALVAEYCLATSSDLRTQILDRHDDQVDAISEIRIVTDPFSHRSAVFVYEVFGQSEAIDGTSRLDHRVRNADAWIAVCGRGLMAADRMWRKAETSPWHAKLSGHRTMGVGLLLVIVCLAMAFVRVDFRLAVSGRVLPSNRVNVFAPATGQVAELFVSEGDELIAGAPLFSIESAPLNLSREQLRGRLSAAETRLIGLQTQRSGGQSNGGQNSNVSSTKSLDEQMVRTEIASLTKQLALIDRQIASLDVSAALSGRVTGRGMGAEMLGEELVGQTVAAGQWLMSINAVDQDWNVELMVPDDQVGLLRDAKAGKTAATFRVLNRPGIVHQATLVYQAPGTVRRADGRSVLPVHLRAKSTLTSDVPIGSSVTAHLDLGKRSLGFVMFRDIVHWYQRQAWF